jgi:putative RNA 2'-phosphotransferase
MVYILGHRPYEFGLVPDQDGFVTFKELLQAIHEESGWGYVRRSNINEVLLGRNRFLYEFDEKRIKTHDQKWKFDPDPSTQPLPKLLYSPVRKRAHPVVMEKGLKTGPGKHIILTPDREMALRIGKRRDNKPVLLEILAFEAMNRGTYFQTFGELFLSGSISADLIAGPPVPKKIIEAKKSQEIKKEKEPLPPPSPTPGTFVLKPDRDPDRARRAKGKKRKGWKEKARKARREKSGSRAFP